MTTPQQPYNQQPYTEQPYTQQPYEQQDPYTQQPGFGQPLQPAYNGGAALVEGRKARRNAWICGVIGLFLFGIVLGFVGFSQANKAEKLGVKATGPKVLAVLDVIFSILSMTYGRRYLGY